MRFLLISFLLGFVVLTPSLQAATVDDLIARATQKNLAQRAQWLALLHYKDEVWSPRIVSQVEDDDFFLAADGRSDAYAELLADIAAMLQPQAQGHAQCLFPARWFWLKQQLGIDERFDVSCPRFERWRRSISADQLTLVFPAMYLNNPGSSFGHTFIRFDNKESVLLSNALNYAASYKPADSLPRYVYNGLFGGYNGVFSMRHYFETVQEYSDLENRDIWEYTLNYTPQEIAQLIRHVWEMLQIDIDYYFFSENCSYRLLALLDVLREDSRLTTGSQFPLYAIPVDTVRALDAAGDISQRTYRPSLASRLQQDLARLTSEERQQVLALVAGERSIEAVEASFTQQQRALIYDDAITMLQFQQQQQTPLAQALLSARSAIDVETPAQQYKQIPPEQGHASARYSIAAGRLDDNNFVALQLRPAFHDLVDAPQGYVPGASINVFQTELRFIENDSLKLEQLSFINIFSLAPLTDWSTPISWLLDVRLQRQNGLQFQLLDRFITQQTKLGAGLTFDLNARVFADKLYALAVLDLQFADELDKGYSVQTGVQLGWLHYDSSGQVKLQLESLRDVSGQVAEQDSLLLQYQFDLQTDMALRFSYERKLFAVSDETLWSLGVNVYF
jgi:hypothetical protein